MISRLHVKGFKSLHDVEVELAPLVVLFGPNASGKSNLLEALMLLARLGTEQTVAKAFESPIRGYPFEAFELPPAGVKGLMEQEYAEVELAGDLRPSGESNHAEPRLLRYRVAVRLQPQTGDLHLIDEYLTRLTRDAQPRDLPRIEQKGESLYIRRRNEAGRPHQEPLPWHHTALSNRQYSGKSYPDFDALRAEFEGWRAYYLDPRTAMRTAEAPRQVTDIGTLGEAVAPFLFRLKQTEKYRKHFQAVSRALRSAIPSVEELDVDLDRERGTLDIQVKENGTAYSSRVISEGTLRMLALCAIAASPWPGGLIAFEEPENGVHPRRIEVIAALLDSMTRDGKRQVIVTTHSPTLVAALVQKQREDPVRIRTLVCSRAGRETRIEPFEAAGSLFQDREIRDALTTDEDLIIIEGLLKRGWLDG